jgi:hypothetical protein
VHERGRDPGGRGLLVSLVAGRPAGISVQFRGGTHVERTDLGTVG